MSANSSSVVEAGRAAAEAVEPSSGAQGPPDLDWVDLAVARASQWLLERQQPDGHWRGELQGDTILESEYILLLAWNGQERSPAALAAARYLLRQQLPEGGWAMYPGGQAEISGSVKAYFALKLTGHDPEGPDLARARRAIRAQGGADAVNSFTRFYLALLGQIGYEHCPAVPPEALLAPNWFPISIYQVSAWSRTILVPLAIMWSRRPTRALPPELGIQELFLKPPDQWPPLRAPGAKAGRGGFTWERLFRGVDALLKTCERWRLTPLRRLALRRAERWMLDRFERSDGLGAIFPPIVWSIIALRCLGRSDDDPETRECWRQLDALKIEENGELRLQPCQSPVWDTALTLRALAAAGTPAESAAIRQARDWLLSKEVRRRGDWAVKAPGAPGGWYFEYRNEFYPDVDDTIMVLMALAEACGAAGDGASAELRAACDRAWRWTRAMRNRDGGWGAFDKNNDAEFLCHVPFADHNAMIDPSTPDITSRVLEALAAFGGKLGDPLVDAGVKFLRRTQEPDGSWPGRWGVNHIYGTWQTLVGLAAAGAPPDDPAARRGVAWLLAHQQADGGWGESADSYEHPERRGQGPATASQTAWALLGLLAAGEGDGEAAARGARWLLRTQQADGAWLEPEFTGTGFPRVFYLRYHYYPIYFPLLALAKYARRARKRAGEPTDAPSR